MKKKTIISLICISMITIGLIAGCGKDDSTTSNVNNSEVSTEDANTSDQVDDADSVSDENSLTENSSDENADDIDLETASAKDNDVNDEAIAALKAWALDYSNLEEWLQDESINDNTKGYVGVVGEDQIPIMILNNDSAIHASGYTWIYTYKDGNVETLGGEDWIEYLDPVTGLAQFCHQGGGYGEVSSFYYLINNKGMYDNEIAYTAILDPQDKLFYDEGVYDEEFYNNMHEMFGDDVYQVNQADVSKQEFETFMKDYKSTEGIADFMNNLEPISDWK